MLKQLTSQGKENKIIIRVSNCQKENWKKLCSEKQISLTSLIINSVEGRILDDERRKIITFIEKQDNIFIKVETNINQLARIVNGQKFISESEFEDFKNQLKIIVKLKEQQNKIFLKIYSLMADDR